MDFYQVADLAGPSKALQEQMLLEMMDETAHRLRE